MVISLSARAVSYFLFIALVCYFLLPQRAIAANADLSRSKVLNFSAISFFFVDNYHSSILNSMQKVDYFLQYKNQELILVQKANKENMLVLSVASKTAKPKTITADKVILKNKTPIQKVLTGTESMNVVITAYSSTPDQTDSSPFITASNKRVRDGIIAANFLPFGTKVKFPALFGDKEFTVEDRMKSNTKVDIWFSDRESALRFGIKRSEMIIVSRP